jgi:hypothetical protein
MTRSRKRWSGRLRTTGALLLLVGTVGLVDLILPRSTDSLVLPSAVIQALAALGALGLGAASFLLGRRWQ